LQIGAWCRYSGNCVPESLAGARNQAVAAGNETVQACDAELRARRFCM